MVLRIAPGLRDRLRDLARASGRSANAVIVDLLEQAMADHVVQKNLTDMVEELLERVENLESVTRTKWRRPSTMRNREPRR
jgi:hypothetical protein